MTDEQILDAAGAIIAARAITTGAEYMLVAYPSGQITVEATVIRHAGTRSRSHTLRKYEAHALRGVGLGVAWATAERSTSPESKRAT